MQYPISPLFNIYILKYIKMYLYFLLLNCHSIPLLFLPTMIQIIALAIKQRRIFRLGSLKGRWLQDVLSSYVTWGKYGEKEVWLFIAV